MPYLAEVFHLLRLKNSIAQYCCQMENATDRSVKLFLRFAYHPIGALLRRDVAGEDLQYLPFAIIKYAHCT